MEKYDVVDNIIEYESGQLSDKDTLKLFANLIKSGQAWSLQGHYGRTARVLIDDNWIDNKGNINQEKVNDNGI